MKKLSVLTALIISVMLTSASSCRRTQAEQRYELKGKVVSVEPEKQQVTITHEDVKGYMPGMTMPFTLSDQAMLSHIQGGDDITATLVVDGSHVWLEEVITSRKSADTNGPTAPAVTVVPDSGAEVPDFQLVNQFGKNIRLRDYRGKTLLLTFIYTRCPIPEYCTLMSTNFRDADRQLQQQKELYPQTHFLSVSLDPEYDTPAVMKSYGAAHTERYQDETFEHWEFATGSKEQIKTMAEYFGLTYIQENDQIVHGLRTAIVGPDGKVKKIYRDNKWKPDEVVKEISAISSSPR
jgi:protein SCO1/2